MRISKLSKQAIITFLIATSSIYSFAQGESKTFGKGINFMAKDSTMSMKMNVRMQALFSSGLDDLTEQATTQLYIRRYRLKFAGFAYNPNLRYKMELGISNRDQSNSANAKYNSESSNIILDAVVKYKFANGHLDLWAGQTKLPGNRERVVSSANLQFVDRSLVNSRFNIDRDQGLQLHGKFNVGKAVIRPIVAWSMGEGRNITALNIGGYDYTGRLEVLPFGEFEGKKQDYIESSITRQSSPKLMLGVTCDYNDRASRQRGQLGSFVTDSLGNLVTNSLSTVFIDMIFKYKGWSVSSEFAHKTAEKQIEGLTKNFGTGTGFTAQAGYLFDSNFEIAARYTTVKPDNEKYSEVPEEVEYTIGVSKYIVGHSLKIQSDVSYFDHPSNDIKEDYRFRLQFELQI